MQDYTRIRDGHEAWERGTHWRSNILSEFWHRKAPRCAERNRVMIPLPYVRGDAAASTSFDDLWVVHLLPIKMFLIR